MTAIRNYFEPGWVAARYAASRPEVHADVARAVAERIPARAPLESALDVGCGTGLSTRPLRALARRVIGLDLASAMLREALRAGGAGYARGRAEALPFADDRFDLVTIGCAYHWCETDPFLREVLRVLRPEGHLVVYDSLFFGESPRDAALFDWLETQHWPRLPLAPRNPLPEPGASPHPSFALVGSAFVETWVPMSRRALVTYLTTQSGAVAAVESGERPIEDLEGFLLSGLSGLVPEEGAEFRFGGPLWILRPGSPEDAGK